MTTVFVKNGRLVALSISVLVVAGLGALVMLPRTEDPRVLNRVATVLTPFPGASATRVEALVSEKIENKLRELPEIKVIFSSSQPGLSVVNLELKDTITNTETVWSRARDLLADVQPELPPGALPSRFDDDRGYAFTTLIALRWRGPGEPNLAILGRYAEELRNRLRAVAGTDLVQRFGEAEEEILVAIDANHASAAGLSADAIASALAATDTKVTAGQLHNQSNRLLVEVSGELDSVERIRQVPLAVSVQGEVIRVSDVAEVRRQVKTPPDELVLLDGQPGIVVAARMLPNLRIDQWTVQWQAILATFEQLLPGNIAAEVIFDQNIYTQTRLGELAQNVLIGFVIILAVLLVTLGLRPALIVALALPFTVLFTLACMHYYGLPIHQMSVTGLVVALGIMVDNAIVMTDMIQQRRQRGLPALQAVAAAVQHLWLPLLGSTLTTILAFAPIALMPGPAGEFVGGIALSVIFALIGSYLISHTLIAGLAGRYLRSVAGEQRRWTQTGLSLPQLAGAFKGSLYLSLRYPRTTIGLVILVPILGFASAQWLTEQFFPPSDRDMFNVELLLPAQTSIDGTAQTVRQVSAILEGDEAIENVHWFIGNSAPPFYYNLLQNKDGRQNFAQAMVKARDFRAANRLIPELQWRLDDAFPEAQILVRKLEQGPPFNAPLEIRLYGLNLATLQMLGDEVRRILFATPDITHTRATLVGGTPKIWVNVNEEASRLTGLPLTELAQRLNSSLEGALEGSMLEGTEDIPVRIRVDGQRRKQLSDLASLNVVSPEADFGQTYAGISLNSLAELRLTPSLEAIPRRNGERVNTIEGYIRADILPQTVLQRFQEKLAEADFALPPGYRLEIGGESAERNQAVGNLLANIGVIATLLVAVVVLSFNSFRLSGIVFAVAAQSAGLGILCVFLFGYPFGFTVIVGLLGLMGLAINAAIVILAELRADPAAAGGDSEAIAHGVMACTRHIVSTTITTVGGFMPLILAGGGFWPPFAITIAGGTVLTTLLSFYFVPSTFLLFARKRGFQAPLQPEQIPMLFLEKKPPLESLVIDQEVKLSA